MTPASNYRGFMSELQPLGEGIFVVDGPVVRDMGLPFETRMTVVQLSDGSVWIASPVPVRYATLAEIGALGPVRYLVSPTPRHHWRLNEWHRLFPDAELWSSPVTAFTLRGGKLGLTGVLGAKPPDAWAADLDQTPIRGSRWVKEVAIFHRPSRTLLLEDIIQAHEHRPGHPMLNALIALGGVKADGGVPCDIRLTFRNREATRRSVDRIMRWDFDKLVMAHGPVVTAGARRFVEDAFSWLDTQRA